MALFLLLVVLSGVSLAGDKALRVTNEMIYEKLLEMEKRQAVLEAQFREFKESVDKRFEQVDRRFEELREDMNKRFEELRADTNKRFEQVNKRFEELRADMNKRFEEQLFFMKVLAAIFTSLVVAVIAFAWWDRRTIIRKAQEETVAYLEREGKLRSLIEALRELAKADKRLAEILRHYGLL